MHRDSCPLDCKVYVGNLGNNGNKTELEWAFGYYGPLRSVWVARNPPGFAFVEFEDPRDAAAAVRELDGRTLVLLPPCTLPLLGHGLQPIRE
uniref:RRM domain-containing protein n=1 Tax=Mus spicilegus TaxID=10103 RepID=A0A8C6HFV6_MUSSI